MKILTMNINEKMLMSTSVLKQILCDYTMRDVLCVLTTQQTHNNSLIVQ